VIRPRVSATLSSEVVSEGRALEILGAFLESEKSKLSSLDLQLRYSWRDLHSVASSLLTSVDRTAPAASRPEVSRARALLQRLESSREGAAARDGEGEGGGGNEFQPVAHRDHDEPEVGDASGEKPKKKKKDRGDEKKNEGEGSKKRSAERQQRKEAKKKAKKEARRAKREAQEA
jgi:hypothetical protein